MIGLPRLFQMSGAQTVIMSLWRVDDAATQYMMGIFAEELLKSGRAPTAHAVAVRRTRDSFPDPAHWASFAVFGSGPF
jgi:CHAT domain-containing protein